MNFSSVNAITIPEGNVTQIQCGDNVLWRQVELLRGLSVSIYYKSKNQNAGSSNATYSFTVTIGGIPAEYVQSFGVKMNYYITANSMITNTKTVTAELLSVDDTTKTVTKTVTFTGPVKYDPSFTGFITYTDLDGKTKTLTTSRVSSVYGSATASV